MMSGDAEAVTYEVVLSESYESERDTCVFHLIGQNPKHAGTWLISLARFTEGLALFPGPYAHSVEAAATRHYGRETHRALFLWPDTQTKRNTVPNLLHGGGIRQRRRTRNSSCPSDFARSAANPWRRGKYTLVMPTMPLFDANNLPASHAAPVRVLRGDSRTMTALADASVELVVTSPPYWQIKDYDAPGQIGWGQSLHE